MKERKEGQFMVRGRLSYPHLFKADEGGDTPRYRCTLILDPQVESEKQQILEIRAYLDELAKEKKSKLPDERRCLKKYLLTEGDDGYDPAYGGKWQLSIGRRADQGRPTVLDADRSPLTIEDGKPYAGCYVKVLCNIWWQDHKKHGKRGNASLEGVQFVSHGEALGAAVATKDDFEDESDGLDDADQPDAGDTDDL